MYREKEKENCFYRYENLLLRHVL